MRFVVFVTSTNADGEDRDVEMQNVEAPGADRAIKSVRETVTNRGGRVIVSSSAYPADTPDR